MAAAGTGRAGGAFAVREVVLERPRWLDGGCERARRGYLYGQLCCVGACGRGAAGGGHGLPGSRRLREGAERAPQVQPRPPLRKHLGRRARSRRARRFLVGRPGLGRWAGPAWALAAVSFCVGH